MFPIAEGSRLKTFHKKMVFLELVLVYVLILFAVTGNVSAKKGSQAASKVLQEEETDAGTDPYQELKKRIALTFDDGPDPRYTIELLDGLKEREVCATFFVMGKQAEQYPEIIKRMEEEGHLIGNHTYSHMQLKKSNREKFKEELTKTSEIIRKITGEELQYVRPPYGAWDKAFETELNMFPVLWTIDPLDWCKSDASGIVRNVLSKAGENDIILMHDQYPSSVAAALEIVDTLEQQGYEFVTVEDLLVE